MPGNVTQIAASSAPMSIPSSSASVATTPSSSPATSRALELAPLLRRVAGAVGRDPLGQLGAAAVARAASCAKRAISSTALRDFMNTIVRAPSITRSASRSAASASAERARGELLVDDRRVPHRDRALGGRASRRGRSP